MKWTFLKTKNAGCFFLSGIIGHPAEQSIHIVFLLIILPVSPNFFSRNDHPCRLTFFFIAKMPHATRSWRGSAEAKGYATHHGKVYYEDWQKFPSPTPPQFHGKRLDRCTWQFAQMPTSCPNPNQFPQLVQPINLQKKMFQEYGANGNKSDF